VILDGAAPIYARNEEENILDAALRRASSCRTRAKAACARRAVQAARGEVDMDVNFALEDYEIARGFILCCQSYAVTDKVVVDFDQTA
jgi:ring-1,2-phenylacetyl-CoA epoxidase subunit PaaE